MTIHEKIKSSEYVLYQDEEICMVLDYDPIAKGHVLILPQKAYHDIDEIPQETLIKIFKAAQKYITLVKSLFSSKGYSIMQNGGAYNDIAVFHLHVIPRYNESEFGYRGKERSEKNDIPKFRKLMKLELER